MFKMRLVVLLAITVAPFGWQPVTAQNPLPESISVDGHASVRVVPNQVVLTVGVETFDVDLAAAKQDNDERVNALLAVAKASHIEAKDLRTEFLNIQPQYKNHNDHGNFLRYLVRKTIVITLRDIGEFEALLSKLLESGVNYVHGVEFQTTELKKHRDKAEALAVAAARDRAQTVAKGLGRSLGEVRSIRVASANWSSSYGHWGRSSRRMAQENVVIDAEDSRVAFGGPTVPGQIAITARVSVSFLLED